ncbi:MAG: hypothetical protein QM760_15025 [Nibricoccus sp.]
MIAICEQTKRDLVELLGVDEKKIVVHYQSCDPLFYDKISFDVVKAAMREYGLDRPIHPERRCLSGEAEPAAFD